MEKRLNFFQKMVAYLMFLSVVIRALQCYQTKRFTSESQWQEFRLYSLSGVIGFAIVLGLSSVINDSMVLLYIFFGFFVLVELMDRRFRISRFLGE